MQYSFGNWGYYARHWQDLYHAVKALGWPAPGAVETSTEGAVQFYQRHGFEILKAGPFAAQARRFGHYGGRAGKTPDPALELGVKTPNSLQAKPVYFCHESVKRNHKKFIKVARLQC